ncbi:MAG: outer membrane protein assembly factor BamD [Rickettsiales bacterium]|jgi:outer membrane protein assembly factor BamD|nr:outer membrane protein assembly factor BamD [Rickettsiales bacterium]
MKKFFIILLLLLISCADKEIIVTYNDAMQQLKDGSYLFAAENFEKLDDMMPFTQDAQKGLVMSAYSFYKAKEYDESNRVIEYFIRNNPINENVPYMYYLRGLNYEARITSITRAKDNTETANESYKSLLLTYPKSIYTDDVKERLIRINNDLAGNDLAVGNWYFNDKNYIGAINHYKNIIKNYKNTEYEAEALYRLVELHNIFNLKVDALKYYVELNNRYKDTTWTVYAFKIIEGYEKN